MDFPESLALLIIKLSHAMALNMGRRLKTYDITMSQWTILKQLWQQESRSQVELQELLGLDAATVTGLVQRMASQGLIQRKPDPSDKRIQRVFLTERGRALEHIATSLVEEVNANILEGFSADERTFFIRLLTRALHNCGQ